MRKLLYLSALFFVLFSSRVNAVDDCVAAEKSESVNLLKTKHTVLYKLPEVCKPGLVEAFTVIKQHNAFDFDLDWSKLDHDLWHVAFYEIRVNGTEVLNYSYDTALPLTIVRSQPAVGAGLDDFEIRACSRVGLDVECGDWQATATHCDIECTDDSLAVPTLTMPGQTNTTGDYTVSWSDHGYLSYEIQQQTDNAFQTLQNNSNLNISLSNQSNNTSFTYRVRGYQGHNIYTSYSTPESVTVELESPVFNALTATSTTGDYTVSWLPVAYDGDVVTYELEESTDNSSWLPVAQDQRFSTAFNNKTNGETFYYRVRACRANANCSDYSLAPNPAVHVALEIPVFNNVITESTTGTYDVSWGAVSYHSDVVTYRLQERAGNGSWNTITSTNFTATTVEVNHQTNGVTYEYRVQACRAGNNCSLFSAFVGVTVLLTSLDFECTDSGLPGPLRIDCPNDEFYSLPNHPGVVANPETFAEEYQWGADYMDFAYGWYYTHGTARVAIVDQYIATGEIDDYKGNLRETYSGTFASVNQIGELGSTTGNSNPCKQVTPMSDHGEFNWDEQSNFSFGQSNPKQFHINNYPDVFVNEYHGGGHLPHRDQSASWLNGGIQPKLEIAIKNGFNTSNFSITIETENLNNNPLSGYTTLPEDSPVQPEDVENRTYYLSDFMVGQTVSGYTLYTLDRSVDPEFSLNSCGPGRLSEDNPGGLSLQNQLKIGGTLVGNMQPPPEHRVCDIHNTVKLGNTVLLKLKVDNSHPSLTYIPDEHKQVKSCDRFYSEIVAADNGGNHGSMVLSLLGSRSNNGFGMSSLCRECSLAYFDFLHSSPYVCSDYPSVLPSCPNQVSVFGSYDNRINAYQYALESGNQILNWSGFIDQYGGGILEKCDDHVEEYQAEFILCQKIRDAKARDMILVAAAGNDLGEVMNWPARETEMVIGVAGIQPTGNYWDDSGACPPPNNGHECGSQHDSTTLFAAPAKSILAGNPAGDYNSGVGCVDSNFEDPDDGYQRCSGTSFAAPHVTSVVAMMRSINPLLSFENVKSVLSSSDVNPVITDYSVPSAANAVEILLGESSGQQVLNRLTPMFRLKATDNAFQSQVSHLSTTIPQVAVAAIYGTYLEVPEKATGKISTDALIEYTVDGTSPLVSGYSQFKSEGNITTAPRAPFYLFSGRINPFNESQLLKPLYRFSKPKQMGGSCHDISDHAYAINRNNGFTNGNNFCGNSAYDYEGIEGYILDHCPPGISCYESSNNPDDLQCLKLRYSATEKSFAIMMASELGGKNSQFSGYGTNYVNRFGQTVPINSLSGIDNAECLGYVFPNADFEGDGIIDGMELILGTSLNSNDSDNDGIPDAVEYPLTGIPASDPMVDQ